MRLSRIPTNKEWEDFARHGPGARMYNGKMTLFWDGETLRDNENQEWLLYDEEERLKWEVIIVLPGVEVIAEYTFFSCMNVKTVIMADTVRRIGNDAFNGCCSLVFVKLSRNIEYIGEMAFYHCESLPSVFIPPSCRRIRNSAFWGCKKLIILSVPRNTQLGRAVIKGTALIKASPFETDEHGYYELLAETDVNEWIKNHHADNQFSLH